MVDLYSKTCLAFLIDVLPQLTCYWLISPPSPHILEHIVQNLIHFLHRAQGQARKNQYNAGSTRKGEWLSLPGTWPGLEWYLRKGPSAFLEFKVQGGFVSQRLSANHCFFGFCALKGGVGKPGGFLKGNKKFEIEKRGIGDTKLVIHVLGG